MMQNALFDKETLVIEYDRSRDDECMKCHDCVKVCPVGIDIKEGLKSVGGAAFLAGVVLVVMVYSRPEVTFFISRDPERLPQGINRYSWSLYNNTATSRDLELSAGESFVIIGETTLMLEPYSFIKGKVLVRSDGGKDEVVFRLEDEEVSIEKKVGFL